MIGVDIGPRVFKSAERLGPKVTAKAEEKIAAIAAPPSTRGQAVRASLPWLSPEQPERIEIEPGLALIRAQLAQQFHRTAALLDLKVVRQRIPGGITDEAVVSLVP